MSAGILKRVLAVLLLAALSLSAAGCASWEEMETRWVSCRSFTARRTSSRSRSR